MEEPVSEASDEQIPEKGGEDKTGVIPPVDEPVQEPAPGTPADPDPDAPVQEPAPGTPADPDPDAPVDEPVPGTPADPDPDAPVDEPVVTDPEAPVDPDAPVDEPVVTEPEDTDAAINADDDEVVKHTVSIKDYRKVLNSVSISAAADGALKISNDGKITVEGDKTVTLTITPKTHWDVKSVKSGGEDWSGSGPYTKEIKEDTEVEIEVVATYTFTLDAGATGITLQRLTTDAEGKDVKVSFEAGEIEKDGADLKLITSYTKNDTTSLTFSYGADGEEAEPLEGVEQEDPTDPKEKVVVYTIPASVVASLDSLKIVLVKNEQKTVTFEENTKVEVKVWGEKTPADGDKPAVMDWVTVPSPYKVIAGENAKFKATAKDFYKITKVTATVDEEETEYDASADGTYELKIEADTAISFDTEIDSAKSKSLTFNLAADKGSATAKVTGVTLKKTDAAGSDKVLNESSDPTLTAFLTDYVGAADGTLDPEATEPVKIPDTVKDITVEVKAAASGDYKLSKINNTAVKTANPDETTTATRKINYADIGEVKVETTAVTSGDATYFKINPNKKSSENASGVEHIEVKIDAKAGGTFEAVAGKENVYKVKSGTGVASFTIEAAEGWALPADFVTTLKTKTGVVDVTDEVKDKKVIYTVKLLARKLGADDTTNLVDLGSITGEEIRAFSVAVDTEASSAEETYTMAAPGITEDANFPATGATGEDNIPYNAKLATTITAASGYTLKSVTGTMGGTALPAIEVLDNTATIEIAKVTGDVKFTVTTAKAYTVTLGAATGDNHTPTRPDLGMGDETWAVRYDKKYAVNVTPAVAIKDLSAEIKDGETVVGRGKKIGSELQLWMTKAWAGKELTVDVKENGTKIGELTLQVNKQRSTLNIKSEGTIKQDVASTAVYEIETDGEKLTTSVVPVVTGALGAAAGGGNGKVTARIDETGNLEVTVAPAKFEDVNTVTTTTVEGETVRTVTPKEAKITITDPEDDTLEAEVTVTANAIFDTASKPSVSLVDGGASDTVLNVSVGMDGVIAPKDGTSKVYYVITAKAKDDVPASADTPASNRDADKLEPTVTEIVERKGSSQRVALQVGTSTNLGEGAEWAYDVTATAVYALNGAEPTGTANSVSTAGDKSQISDKLETGTVTPLFEAGLKLKKDSKKKPASTLYTGQSDLYIATPQWSKKNVNYKITASASDNLDELEVAINDAGDLVVTDVPEYATLGKHTLTVIAKADETTGHTMYASRATINVTVVKGINTLGVNVPASQIFKQANKAATLKATPDYVQYRVDGKPVYPKTKKVTWSIVGGRSTIDGEEFGTGTAADLDTTAAPAGITVKNGTVTVAKSFTVDKKHPQNNSFKVLIQAADFAGNTRVALSSEITVTDKAADISNLVIARYDGTKGGYNVIAVKTGTKSAKAQDVKAEDITGAYVYAMSGTVAPGFVSNAKWVTLGVVDSSNLKYAPVKGNLSVSANGRISAIAGKKATITVSTTDGGKKKNSFALNLGYTEADPTAALMISATDADGNRATPIAITPKPTKETDAAAKVEKEYTLPGVAKLNVTVYSAVRDDKGAFKKFEEISSYANYKLSIKGGKFANDGRIYTTAKVTTLTLTVGKGKAAKKYTYVLTNKAYEETAKPKVTVKNSLHTYGSDEEQKVKMIALNGKDSFGDNKYAKVELDKTTMPKDTAKNWDAWWQINNSIKNNYIKLDKATGEFALEFEGYEYYTAGSYKLKVTIGEGANAGTFKAKTQPVNVTLKVVKNKSFTFKPVTSYTINKVDGGAVLTGKANVNVKAGEKVYTNFTKLQNANVNGKSNLFTHYFTIASDPVTGTQRITLNTEDPLVEKLLYEPKADGTPDKSKPIADPDLSSIAKDKANLTGYLTYTVRPNVDYYYGAPVLNNTVKITVKIAPEAKKGKYKATQKYIPEGGTEIGLKKNATTQVNILVNGRYVSVAHAIVDETKAKNNAAELGNEVTVNNKGQIVLKAVADLDATKKGGYSINLLIVPATSFFAKAITDTTKADEKKALIQRYGTPVKVTVVAKEKPKATADPSASSGGGGGSDEPDVPPTEEKTQAEVETMVNTWIGTLTGTKTWLKNDTTIATLTTKANEDASIRASGWTVAVTDANFTGASAATANAAATQVVAISIR